MIEIRLGDRYAKSILDLAREKGQTDRVRDDFALIDNVCKQNPDFQNLLKSPLVGAGKKQKIINMVFEGKLSEITDKLIKIIVRKHREAYLRDIAVRYQALHDVENNLTRGLLASAVELSAEHKNRLKSMVEKAFNTTFEYEEKIDPSLIGGFMLRVGDRLFDGSIATALRKLKQEFEQNPYIEKV